jgi:hypothetical protein
MYVKAMENLVEDGLCAPTKTFRDFFSVEPDIENLLKVVNKCPTRYEQNICELLHNEMKKVFCRMTVSGALFPTEFSDKDVLETPSSLSSPIGKFGPRLGVAVAGERFELDA